jgi:hypothetical protein
MCVCKSCAFVLSSLHQPRVCSGDDASLGAESGAYASLGTESGDAASLDPESPSGHSRLLSAFAQTHTVYARTHTQTHIPLWIEIRIDFRTKIGPQVFLFFSSFPPLCPHSDHCLLMHFRLQKDGIRLPDERHMPVQLHALRALHFFEREPELLRLQ